MGSRRSSSIFAIVLAAGAGSRFGSTKQLARLGGRALVRHALEIANDGCSGNSLLVVGHDWQAVSRACEGTTRYMIINENHANGLGSSLARAVGSVTQCADAVIVLLADQPLVTAEHLGKLAVAWSGDDDEIVASEYAGTCGPPILFPRNCFAELAELSGDAGGKHLLGDSRFQVLRVPFDDAAVDIDTPADLEALRGS